VILDLESQLALQAEKQAVIADNPDAEVKGSASSHIMKNEPIK
jgi:hypothetical protein